MYKNTREERYVGELFQRYSHLVFGVCMKYLKDEEESRDAVMSIFEKLLSDLPNRTIDTFKPWVHTVAKNHCLMFLRKHKNKIIHNEEFQDTFMENHHFLHPENDDTIEDMLQGLDECIEKLVNEQKACIHLFYIEEKCYKEIAVETGFELNKVKSYIQNGKRNLKLCMDNILHEQEK